MDGEIRTAVEGVDPGEPGQATSAEGLHPPFLSLSQVTLLLSYVFCPFLFRLLLLRVCLLFFFPLSLKNSLHLAGTSEKKHLKKKKNNVKRHPGVQQADGQSEPEKE